VLAVRSAWRSHQSRTAAILTAAGIVSIVIALLVARDDGGPAAPPHNLPRPAHGPIRGYAYLQDTRSTLLLRRAYVGLIVLVNDGRDDAVLEAVHLRPFPGHRLPTTRFYFGGMHPRGLGAEPARGRTFRGVALTPAIGSRVVGTTADPHHAGTLLVIRADRPGSRVVGWRSVTVVYRYHGERYRTLYRTGVAMCSLADNDRIC
jgi:hypothetical protein